MKIMLFGEKLKEESSFTDFLKKYHKVVFCSKREEEAHTQLQSNVIGAVVALDEDFSFIKELISQYPMVNYALLSSQASHVFHEMTEGYGIFMQLPLSPTKDDALEMMNKLDGLSVGFATQKEGKVS